MNHFINKSILLYLSLTFVLGTSLALSGPLPKGIKSIEEVEKSKDDTIKVKKYFEIADTLVYSNDDSAGIYFRKADALARKLNYKKGILFINQEYRKHFIRKGDFKEALKLDKQTLAISNSLKDSRLIAGAYTNLGQINSYLGNFQEASAYYLKSIKYCEEYGDSLLLGRNLNNLANVFMDMEDTKKGIFYAEKAYSFAVKNKSIKDIATTLLTVGNAYGESGDYETAKKYFKLQLTYSDSLRPTSYRRSVDNSFSALVNLGEIELRTKNFQDALRYTNQAKELLAEVPFPDNELYVMINLADIHYQLRDYKEAEHYILKSMQISKEIGAANELRKIYKLASDIAEHSDLRLALDYRKQYEILNDSIQSVEKEGNLQKLEVEYQTEKKEKEIAQHELNLAKKEVELKNKSQVITLTVSMIIILAFLLAIIFILHQNRQKAIMERMALLEKEKELQVLEAMINGEERERSRLAKDLHDGVGGLLSATKMHLSIIKNEQTNTTGLEKFDHTMSILDSASKEIRTIAHNLAPEILINRGLDTALENFCESVNSSSLRVNYYSVGSIPRLKNNVELIIYRVAQELLNNIIKHSKGTEANIQLSHHDDLLTLSVEDNGVGLNDSGKNGIGLLNLKSRIESLNGDLSIDSKKGEGTTIYIEIETSKFKTVLEEMEAMAS